MAAIAADRHLLLGLLALQNGLIHQSQLVAAFQAWTLEKSRPLADHLVALGHLSPAQRSVIEAMAALHLEAHGGEVEKSLAAVPAGKSTLESLAAVHDPDIERTLSRVGSARPPADDGDADRTASYAVGTATADGQRFRILRPHARGGLGAVFVALDEELHREVALKQILDQHSDDPTSRARFLLEAEITGGLEHPGIVPIYGLGAYADGRPYYAMRFIRGDSLKEAADRFHADEALKKDPGQRSLEMRQLLRRFLDVCNAIDYAHSRGILHRDIKPGNVIVGKYGETLVVDWGLAKAVGRVDPGIVSGERPLVPSSASGSASTLPGSALGTPAYMSPEQADGDLERLGPRSDVYSLGATLYYLMTGRTPVQGDIVEMIRAAQRGEFPPPRQVDPTIDRALQAVCLKAMAHQPEDRYANARELAEDVDRWLADEPVSAWREPLMRRARRWARRNRAAMTTIAVAVLVALAGTGAVLAVQTRANAELKWANERERQRFDLAMEAIKLFHGEVSEDLLLKEKEFAGLRSKLLKGATDFYGKLERLLEGQADPSSQAALGRAYFELAELTDKIGSRPEALQLYRRALAIRRELARVAQAGADAHAEVARCLLALGAVADQTGHANETMAAYEEARALLERITRPVDPARDFRAEVALCDHRIGDVLAKADRRAEALDSYQKGRAIREGLLSERPGGTELRSGLAESDVAIGNMLWECGRPAEALAAFQKARAVSEELARDHPTTPEFRRRLAQCYQQIAYPLHAMGDTDEAIQAFELARGLLEALVQENPNITEFRHQVAGSHIDIGILLWDSGRPADALARYEKARPLLEALARDHPDVTGIRSSLAACYDQTAHVLWAMGKVGDARVSSDHALALNEAIVAANPSLAGYQSKLALTVSFNGVLQREARQFSLAVASFRKAIDLFDQLRARSPEDYYNRACNRSNLAGVAGRPGSGLSAADGQIEADRAMADLHRAADGGFRMLSLIAQDHDLDPLRSRADFRLLLMDLAMPATPFAAAR